MLGLVVMKFLIGVGHGDVFITEFRNYCYIGKNGFRSKNNQFFMNGIVTIRFKGFAGLNKHFFLFSFSFGIFFYLCLESFLPSYFHRVFVQIV